MPTLHFCDRHGSRTRLRAETPAFGDLLVEPTSTQAATRRQDALRRAGTCHDFFRNMGRGGRFGKYGEVKRFERLRQKQRGVLPLKPLKKLSDKKSSKT